MKKINNILLFALLACSCSLANAAAVQVWTCKMNDGKTAEDLDAASSAWLAATKSMKGAEKIKAFHEFPVATGAVGDGAFNFVVITPNFEDWGKVTEAYPDSASQKADVAWGEVASCDGSTLWASEEIE